MTRPLLVIALALPSWAAFAQPVAPQAAPAPAAPAQAAGPRWNWPGPPPPPRRPARRFMFQLDLGASLHSLYDTALYAGEVRLLFASRNADWFIGGGPAFHIGETARGRGSVFMGARVSMGAFVGRFTLGGGLEFAWLIVDGASGSGSNHFLGVGVHATALVDVLRAGRFALTAGLDGTALLVADTRLLSGALLLGFRL